MRWTYCNLERKRFRPVRSVSAACIWAMCAYVVFIATPSPGGWILSTLSISRAIWSLVAQPSWREVFLISSVVLALKIVGDSEATWVFCAFGFFFVCLGYVLGAFADIKIDEAEFYRSLVHANGTEYCQRPDCNQKRVRMSVLCREHHFQMICREHPEILSGSLRR